MSISGNFLTGFNSAMRASEMLRRTTPAQTHLEKQREVKAREEFEREKVVVNHGPNCREVRFNGGAVIFNPEQLVKISCE